MPQRPRGAVKNFQIGHLKNFQTGHFIICIHVKRMILTNISDTNRTWQRFTTYSWQWAK